MNHVTIQYNGVCEISTSVSIDWDDDLWIIDAYHFDFIARYAHYIINMGKCKEIMLEANV